MRTVIEDPKACGGEQNIPVVGGLQNQRLGQLDRIERLLLVQVEVVSKALVLSDASRSHKTAPASLNKAFLVAVLVSAWLSALVLAVAWIRLTGQSSQTGEQIPIYIQRIIRTTPESQEKIEAASVSRKVSASVALSARLDQREKSKELRGNDDQPGSAKVNTTKPHRVPIAAPVVAARPNTWDPLRDTQPTKAAVAHTAPDGTIDYWLLPHGPFFSDAARVVPIGRSPNGVYVHNLEDGKNYRLSPSGDWYVLVVPPQ